MVGFITFIVDWWIFTKYIFATYCPGYAVNYIDKFTYIYGVFVVIIYGVGITDICITRIVN